MSRRKSRASKAAPAQSGYHDWIREADEFLAREGAQPRPDNWQQLALDWFPSNEAEREALARYIARYEEKLGVTWARDLLRLEVFFRAHDTLAVVTHYKRALRAYPPCAVVEVWLGAHLLRYSGELWLAWEMYLNAARELPTFARPFYELGFIHHLLGDFAGALEYFDQAAARVTDEDRELAARVFYNRGATRFLLTADRQAAIADIKESLRYKPDYAQAKDALRALKLNPRWVPW